MVGLQAYLLLSSLLLQFAWAVSSPCGVTHLTVAVSRRFRYIAIFALVACHFLLDLAIFEIIVCQFCTDLANFGPLAKHLRSDLSIFASVISYFPNVSRHFK